MHLEMILVAIFEIKLKYVMSVLIPLYSVKNVGIYEVY